ncbi:tetratricopeptide repeat protein [Acidobacteriota bacterium]
MRIKSSTVIILCLSFVFCASAKKNLQIEQSKDPQFQYNMGLFYLNEGNPDQAIIHLDTSLKLKPRNYLVLHALGIAFSMKGEMETSAARFNDALMINPSSTETRNLLGVIYQEMGALDKAEKEFLACVADRTYISRALPHYNLARLYHGQNKLQDAIFHLESALDLNPRFIMALNLKGLVLEKQDRLAEAIRSYRQALDSFDHFADENQIALIEYNLAVAYFKSKDYPSARQIFERIYNKISDPEQRRDIDKYLKLIK